MASGGCYAVGPNASHASRKSRASAFVRAGPSWRIDAGPIRGHGCAADGGSACGRGWVRSNLLPHPCTQPPPWWWAQPPGRCGLGSILIPMSYFGTYCMGLEIDPRVLRGTGRPLSNNKRTSLCARAFVLEVVLGGGGSAKHRPARASWRAGMAPLSGRQRLQQPGRVRDAPPSGRRHCRLVAGRMAQRASVRRHRNRPYVR